MDFTRAPLIETVITPKEGFKLTIRAASGGSQEEYLVGAVEVVSFGNCYFFRSLEKPKDFLLPMNEYEIIETREIRTVLKKPQVEKSIKIGGGHKPSVKQEQEEEETPKEEPKKREKKRTRKRRSSKKEQDEAPKEAEGTPKKEIEPAVLQQRRTLLPPPTSLISEQIDRYKNYLVEQGALRPEDLEEKASSTEEKIVEITEEVHSSFEEES